VDVEPEVVKEAPVVAGQRASLPRAVAAQPRQVVAAQPRQVVAAQPQRAAAVQRANRRKAKAKASVRLLGAVLLVPAVPAQGPAVARVVRPVRHGAAVASK